MPCYTSEAMTFICSRPECKAALELTEEEARTLALELAAMHGTSGGSHSFYTLGRPESGRPRK